MLTQASLHLEQDTQRSIDRHLGENRNEMIHGGKICCFWSSQPRGDTRRARCAPHSSAGSAVSSRFYAGLHFPHLALTSTSLTPVSSLPNVIRYLSVFLLTYIHPSCLTLISLLWSLNRLYPSVVSTYTLFCVDHRLTLSTSWNMFFHHP